MLQNEEIKRTGEEYTAPGPEILPPPAEGVSGANPGTGKEKGDASRKRQLARYLTRSLAAGFAVVVLVPQLFGLNTQEKTPESGSIIEKVSESVEEPESIEVALEPETETEEPEPEMEAESENEAAPEETAEHPDISGTVYQSSEKSLTLTYHGMELARAEDGSQVIALRFDLQGYIDMPMIGVAASMTPIERDETGYIASQMVADPLELKTVQGYEDCVQHDWSTGEIGWFADDGIDGQLQSGETVSYVVGIPIPDGVSEDTPLYIMASWETVAVDEELSADQSTNYSCIWTITDPNDLIGTW